MQKMSASASSSSSSDDAFYENLTLGLIKVLSKSVWTIDKVLHALIDIYFILCIFLRSNSTDKQYKLW